MLKARGHGGSLMLLAGEHPKTYFWYTFAS